MTRGRNQKSQKMGDAIYQRRISKFQISKYFFTADGGSSDCSTISSSIMPPVTSFDRHLVLIGCQSFQAFFDRYPEVLSHFDKFNAIEIDGVLVSSALKMHSSRVLAIVEELVEHTGNPEKIRNMLQDMGRHHYKQV